MKHVLVLGCQVPFVRGGAELLNESLVREINKLDGVTAELVQLPLKWYPEEQLLNDIMAWRLIDVTEANGRKVDLVIPTKFPSYAIEHENKIPWLVHQHRTLYDLENTEYDPWYGTGNTNVIRNKIRNLDNKFFDECNKIFSISTNVSERLRKYNGFDSQPIFPPSPIHEKITPGDYSKTILYIGRLEPNKRPELLIHATSLIPDATVSIIGRGREQDFNRLKELISKMGLDDRCKIIGYVEEDELLRHLSSARAVFYAPFDEDYGYATIEAFLAKKPVITTTDSGQVCTFVSDTGAGFISEPIPEKIADNLQKVYQMNNEELEEMAEPGYELANNISWDDVLTHLVLKNL